MCFIFDRFLRQECVKSFWICILLFALLIPYDDVSAKTWSFHSGVNTALTYTDNIALAPSGQKQDEIVTEIDPQFSVTSDAPRLKLDFKYGMQNLFYARNSRRNNTYHQLSANEASTLVDNFIYFDAGGSISQQIISPEDKVPLDNISLSSNRTNVSTYSFSPYMHHDFGGTATAEARYEYNRVMYSSASPMDSNGRSVSVLLRSGPNFDRVTWNVSHSERRTYYKALPDAVFKRTDGQIGYMPFSSFSLNGTIGYEDNLYTQITPTTPTSAKGKTWSVGFKWVPSHRTSLTGSYGRRAFGRSYSAELSHQSRHATWRASYNEEITSVRDLQLVNQTVLLVDSSGQEFLAQITYPALGSETFVQKTTQISMDRKLRSGGVTVQLREESRHYLSSGGQEHVYAANGRFSWKLNRRANISIGGGWERYNYRGGAGHSDSWSIGSSVSENLSKNVSAGLQVRHQMRASYAASNKYSESRISAYLKMTF